jgi:hypothetical protein
MQFPCFGLLPVSDKNAINAELYDFCLNQNPHTLVMLKDAYGGVMHYKAAICLVGGLMLLGTGAWTHYRMSEQHIDWVWPLRAPNGQSGFAMHFNAPAWVWLTGRPASAIADSMISNRTNTRLTGVIENGMGRTPGACPSHWLLADIHVLPDGSVFVSGYCATQAELERAGRNSGAGVAVL